MGDTVTIEVSETWQEFFSTIDASFTFNNQGPSEVYVRESATEPGPQERGYVFMPSKGGWGKVESGSMWVRSRFGGSRFHYGTFTP